MYSTVVDEWKVSLLQRLLASREDLLSHVHNSTFPKEEESAIFRNYANKRGNLIHKTFEIELILFMWHFRKI